MVYQDTITKAIELVKPIMTKAQACGFEWSKWGWYSPDIDEEQNYKLLGLGYYKYLYFEKLFLQALLGEKWKMHAMNAMKQELNGELLGLKYLYKHSLVSTDYIEPKKEPRKRKKYATKKDA